MLGALFGNESARQVLLYMQNYGEGYGLDMARTFNRAVSPIQKQLQKLEDGGWLVSRPVGKTRIYSWNPRNPLVGPLRLFLQSALDSLPDDEVRTYYRARRRPRKPGKPL